MKAKGQVRLRRKPLKNGNISLYLDIYSGGIRKYEFLRLYLVPERTQGERLQNSETLRLAEAIRARRTIDVQRVGAGITLPSGRSVESLLKEFLETRNTKSEGTREAWRCWTGRVMRWKGCETSAKALSREWWTRYAEWVQSLRLKPSTQSLYLSRMRSVMSWAEREGYIGESPCKGIRIPAAGRVARTYLTAEELRLLKATDCGGEDLKRAFLFSCLSGLRLSDVQALRWEDIEGRRVTIRIKKTKALEYVALNAQAVELLGERKSGKVFSFTTDRAVIRRLLMKWTKAAGIDKHVTYHTSRHTFAVLMLTSGVDIYTLSRLLGHSSVTTTQIYADIVDARRMEAVDRLPQI